MSTFFRQTAQAIIAKYIDRFPPSLSRTERVPRVYRHSWQCRIAAQTGLQAKVKSVNNAVDFHTKHLKGYLKTSTAEFRQAKISDSLFYYCCQYLDRSG